MSWKVYLQELDRQLARWVPDQERQEILRWYTEYFEEAGPEREQEILQKLGAPEVQARELAEQRGYLPKAPVGMTPGVRSGPTRAQVIAAAILVVLLSIPISALFHSLTGSSAGSYIEVSSQREPIYVDTAQVEDPSVYVEERLIYVDIPVGDVVIRQGDALRVSATSNGKDVPLYYDTGEQSVSIYGYSSDFDLSVVNIENLTVEIVVPADWSLYTVDVFNDTGDVSVQGIDSDSLNVYNQVGDMMITDCTVETLYCTGNVGNIYFTGVSACDMNLSTSTGDVVVELEDPVASIQCDLYTNVGDVSVDGVKLGSSVNKSGDGNGHCLWASTDVGSIRVSQKGNENLM